MFNTRYYERLFKVTFFLSFNITIAKGKNLSIESKIEVGGKGGDRNGNE